MKILFLSSILPHSRVVSGFQIVYHRIRLLAERGHEIGILAFKSPSDKEYLSEVKQIVREVHLVPAPQPRLEQLFLGAITGNIPPCLQRLCSTDMQQQLGKMVEETRYDVVIAEFTEMGQQFYRNPYLPAVRRIISCHRNLLETHRHMMSVLAWSPRSISQWIAARGLGRYEARLYSNVDHVLALTPQDRFSIARFIPDQRISIIPYGVDVNHFRMRTCTPEKQIIFTGYFGDYSNVDAVMWFTDSVWPALRQAHPDLRFVIVGRDPTPEIVALPHKNPGIEVTGAVPDLFPYLDKAMVFICPIRLGSGFRGKVLQAMATGLPVVTTQLGAHGIPVEPAQNMMVADTAVGMTRAIDLLVQDSELRAEISKNARELVEQRFSWTTCVDDLESVLNNVMAEG